MSTASSTFHLQRKSSPNSALSPAPIPRLCNECSLHLKPSICNKAPPR